MTTIRADTFAELKWFLDNKLGDDDKLYVVVKGTDMEVPVTKTQLLNIADIRGVEDMRGRFRHDGTSFWWMEDK